MIGNEPATGGFLLHVRAVIHDKLLEDIARQPKPAARNFRNVASAARSRCSSFAQTHVTDNLRIDERGALHYVKRPHYLCTLVTSA